MTISSAVATTGLSALATPTGTLTANDIRIGEVAAGVNFSDADVAYSMLAFFPDTVSTLTFFPFTGLTTGSTSWVAGTRQVETATAAGTITGSGNATVTLTAAGMTGSPKAISVAVLNTDTAATWAGKVRTALAADVDVSAMFDVSGATTAIILTRKAVTTTSIALNTVNTVSIPRYAANDATLNIALANGTCTGITAAPTSADTTAGVVTSGIKIYDGDGLDFEGLALPTIATLYGMQIRTAGTSSIQVSNYLDEALFVVGAKNIHLVASSVAGVYLESVESEYHIQCASSYSYAYFTVIGRTA